MTYALYRFSPQVVQITLPNPGLPLPLGLPTNVYLIDGAVPCLIGAGHPRQRPALLDALGALGLGSADIRRVVALDWSPEQIAGAPAFERADLLAASPDMVQPCDYGALVDAARQGWERQARELCQRAPFDALMDIEGHLAALEDYFKLLPRRLDPVPLRGGHTLQLGELRLQVLDAPGPAPGHLMLYAAEGELLFAGRLVVEHAFGDAAIEEPIAMLSSLEAAFDLKPRVLLPTVGRIDVDGAWGARRAHRTLTSFLSNLPFALQGPMTIPDLLRRDMGYVPSHLTRYLGTVRRYQAAFDELVRSGSILTRDQGIWTVYGAEAPDPRVSRG